MVKKQHENEDQLINIKYRTCWKRNKSRRTQNILMVHLDFFRFWSYIQRLTHDNNNVNFVYFFFLAWRLSDQWNVCSYHKRPFSLICILLIIWIFYFVIRLRVWHFESAHNYSRMKDGVWWMAIEISMYVLSDKRQCVLQYIEIWLLFYTSKNDIHWSCRFCGILQTNKNFKKRLRSTLSQLL